MPFFPGRRIEPRLTLALGDKPLGKVLKVLDEPTGLNSVGRTDLDVGRLSSLLRQNVGDWDRRAHRVSVLGRRLSESSLPATWVEREPRNPDALLLHAWSRLARGRGRGRLDDATSVIRDCCLAADISPRDPLPWVILLEVARVEGRPQQYVFRAWNEAIARDRWNREAYMSMLRYISPDGAGTQVQLLDFVDATRAQMPSNSPCAALELTAEVRAYQTSLARGGVEALVAPNRWTEGSGAHAIQHAFPLWLESGFFQHAAALADLNLLAYSLIAARRISEAGRVFRILAGRVTSWPWQHSGDPVHEFERWHARTAR
ncbi:hypothetical protein ACH475_34385 [Streptomyces globisporus]|uniref:hypothetical protein n=1 Tax=Streptomyces globisporus TaxID=1908 RepID=UPI0037AC8D64